MSTTRDPNLTKNDRPIRSVKDDKLGFKELAERTVISLNENRIKDGFVIGIEGKWGSGKSSLVNLITNRLKKNKKVIIIDFKPWLVDNRDALIDALFSEFVDALKNDFPNKIQFIKFSQYLKDFIKAAEQEFSKVKLFTGSRLILNSIKFFLKKVNFLFDSSLVNKFLEYLQSVIFNNSLSNLKNHLEKIFKSIDRQIIVVIDDLDRLDPSEAVEVLRLVRSVADFPNVTYILCYDYNVLSDAIEKQVKVESGSVYLEKIIQRTISIPQMEYFFLSEWFKDSLISLIQPNKDLVDSIENFLLNEGQFRLNSPRSVVRTLDSISFNWQFASEQNLNIEDFLWIQLIKIDNPDLYRWIEKYCKDAAYFLKGDAKCPDEKIKKDLETLKSILRNEGYKGKYFDMTRILSGSGYQIDDFNIYKIDGENKNINLLNKRLASPDHYHMYFSQYISIYTIDLKEIILFLGKNELQDDFDQKIIELFSERCDYFSNKLFKILNFIKDTSYDWDEYSYSKLIISFSNVMDEINILNDKVVKNTPINNLALNLVYNFFRKNRKNNKDFDLAKKFFKEGKAINWLSFILRSELWAHGKGGGSKQDEELYLFNEKNISEISSIMKKRYCSYKKEKLFQDTNGELVLDVLKGIYNKNFKKYWDIHTKKDKDFIEIIEYYFSNIENAYISRISNLLDSPILDFHENQLEIRKNIRRIESLKEDYSLGAQAKSLLRKIQTL